MTARLVADTCQKIAGYPEHARWGITTFEIIIKNMIIMKDDSFFLSFFLSFTLMKHFLRKQNQDFIISSGTLYNQNEDYFLLYITNQNGIKSL